MLLNVWNRIVKNYYFFIKKDRVAYAKKLGVRIGTRCQLLVDPDHAFGTEPWLISLGDHVDVTAGVQFLTHEGGIWCARGLDNRYEELDKFLPITVGNNVMIGIRTIIMPGVKIGNNVIIAANSIVTKDVEDGMVVAGMPAKSISTVEKFLANLECDNTVVPTKKMAQAEKKEYLQKIHPEWFTAKKSK